MACSSHIKDHSANHSRIGGFTLGEVMLAAFISSFVFAGVLSAYIFLGRGLTRQSNAEMLESRSRLALYYFTQDVSTAMAVDPNGMSPTVLKLYFPDSSDEVTYSYDATQGTLTRTVTGSAPPEPVTSLFTGLPNVASPGNIGLSSFGFTYYDFSGQPATGAPATKQVSMSFTCIAGIAASGAQSHFNVVSPRVMMKSKPLLGTANILP
jgi:hypothetical protein